MSELRPLQCTTSPSKDDLLAKLFDLEIEEKYQGQKLKIDKLHTPDKAWII